MKLSAILEPLIAAGVPGDVILAVVKAWEAEQPDDWLVRKRENDRFRQAIRREECPPAEWFLLRAAVLKRDGFRCVYCGTTDGQMQADHVVPFSRGGRSTMENLVCACLSCNSEKRDRTPDEWWGR